MKKVLFIGITKLNLQNSTEHRHLAKEFAYLSKYLKIFLIARGKPLHKKMWGVSFYLFPKRFLYFLFAFPLAAYICFSKKIDVIVCQSPLTEGLLGTVLKKIFRKELIVAVHGDWQEGPFLSKKRRFEKIQRKFVPILAKLSLRAADKVRVISNYTKEQALKVSGPKPYFIFPTFTDIDSFLEEKQIRFDNFILFVGQMEKVKGVDILIDAFKKIAKEFPEFKLILIGEGSEKKNYQLQDRVELKGRLSLAETRDIMKNCYCLVLPSRSEGLGRVLMEAQALQKPVIGSKVGGIPELIKDGKNGFLFEKENSEELAQKLSILLRDKNLAISMGQKGREFVQKNFSNKKHNESYLNMIYA